MKDGWMIHGTILQEEKKKDTKNTGPLKREEVVEDEKEVVATVATKHVNTTPLFANLVTRATERV